MTAKTVPTTAVISAIVPSSEFFGAASAGGRGWCRSVLMSGFLEGASSDDAGRYAACGAAARGRNGIRRAMTPASPARPAPNIGRSAGIRSADRPIRVSVLRPMVDL
ncbi:hypothetical protein GCM10010910_15310 [Microbacterium nanhaiense]|uniref:Uncharacterized protein n=1 Tax=Microbacterium nanhaiense TaxID=1301026 RepID=A0ABQ2N1M3_9MICO|nr:hypothetical protein GCM10010910_15310 [Microbacterium nanhaiense]